jgi:hypothetical protein
MTHRKHDFKKSLCDLRLMEVFLSGNDSFIIGYLRQPNKQDKQAHLVYEE